MSVLLIPNPTKDTGLAVTRQAAAVLAGRGIPSRGGAHIVAVPTGGEAATARLGERLAQRGVLALAARFPTVPRGGGLLRFGVTALHTRAMLEHAAEVLADLWDGGPASGETR